MNKETASHTTQNGKLHIWFKKELALKTLWRITKNKSGITGNVARVKDDRWTKKIVE